MGEFNKFFKDNKFVEENNKNKTTKLEQNSYEEY